MYETVKVRWAWSWVCIQIFGKEITWKAIVWKTAQLWLLVVYGREFWSGVNVVRWGRGLFNALSQRLCRETLNKETLKVTSFQAEIRTRDFGMPTVAWSNNVTWIFVVQDNKWLAVVNAVTNLRVSDKSGNFSTSWATVSLYRYTLLSAVGHTVRIWSSWECDEYLSRNVTPSSLADLM
jgi:hypothetical protein